MPATLTMPRLGETMEEGTVSAWLVKVGDAFKRGDPLVEFETDKTAVEYPALGPGRLVEVLVGAGDVVKLGQPIARIDLEGAEDWTGAEAEPPTDTPAPAPEQLGAAATVELRTEPGAAGGVRATPAARRAARRAGLDLERVRGTGRRGRIEAADVAAAPSGETLASTSWGPEGGVPALLVHGFAGDRVTFEQLGTGLGRAGLRATAADLPGHGETQAEAASFDDLVAGLSSALDPRRPVHVVAHSLGAAVAVRAAETGGVASLTLISPAGLGLSIDGEFVHGMAEAASPGTVAHLLRRLSDRAAAFSDAIVAEIHADLARGRLKALAAAIAPGGRQAVSVHAALAALAERMPVRILVGHRDRILDWQDALTVSPLIAVHHFPSAGHMPHWDAPAEVADLIARELHHD